MGLQPRRAVGATGSLNGVRPRRPEQYRHGGVREDRPQVVSMESGLEGRNNLVAEHGGDGMNGESQWSPA